MKTNVFSVLRWRINKKIQVLIDRMNVLFAGKRGIWRASIELSQMVSGLLSCLQHYNSFGNSYLVNGRGRLGRITLVFLRGKEITRVIRLMVGGIELFGGKRWNNSSFILLAFFLSSFMFFLLFLDLMVEFSDDGLIGRLLGEVGR